MHLSIVLWLPLAAGLLGAVAAARAARWIAARSAIARRWPTRSSCSPTWSTAPGGLQYVTDETWISTLGIHYKLGVDGLNLVLILSTRVVFFASALWTALRAASSSARALYVLLMGIAETGVTRRVHGAGPRAVRRLLRPDARAVLLPDGVWGGPDRASAVLKLFIYTLVGSLLMLVGAIATGVLARRPGRLDLVRAQRPRSRRTCRPARSTGSSSCFAAAFLVKMPSFPFHGWMPDGYMPMPLPVLAVFSGDPVEGRRLRVPARSRCRCSPTRARTSRS